jgi:hypothetical protein
VTGPPYQTNEPSRAGLPGEAGRSRGWIGGGSPDEQSRQTGWCSGPLGISPHGREVGVLSLSETMRFRPLRWSGKVGSEPGNWTPGATTRSPNERDEAPENKICWTGWLYPASKPPQKLQIFAGRGVVPADKRRQRNAIVRFPGKVIQVRLCGRARRAPRGRCGY